VTNLINFVRVRRLVDDQAVEQLQATSAEDRATENVTDALENPAEKHVPASWTFAQLSKLVEERLGEIFIERAPSPQKTSEKEVAYEIGRSSVHVEPCHSRVTTEYQSEGEEDDLFLDVPEPSVLSKPTDVCELNKVCVNSRQWMLTLLQRVIAESEVVHTHEVDVTVEKSTVEEVPRLFGMAAKALPTPTLAVLQQAVTALQMVEEVAEKEPEVIELFDS